MGLGGRGRGGEKGGGGGGSLELEEDDILGRRNEGELGKLARRLVCDVTSAWKHPGNRGLC